MTLYKIPKCTSLFIELSAPLDAYLLGRNDFNGFNKVIIPDIAEQGVAAAKSHNILRHLLS
ncbi:hypothetical protein D3C73_1598090 [compost metagenome]